MCIIPKILYKINNSFLYSLKLLLFSKYENENIKRILIFRIGTLGDNITAMPSIKNIIDNFPNAQIDLLVSGGKNSILSMDRLIDKKYFKEIINYSQLSSKELAQKLSANNYDLVIELPNNLSTFFSNLRNMIFFRYFAKIKSGFGWQVSTIKLFKRLQDKCIKFDNEIDRLQYLLMQNNIQVSNKKEFILQDLNNKDELYKKYFNKDDKLIAIVVGAKREQNRWPIKYFQEIIKYIIDSEYKVIIIGGKEDLEITKYFENNKNLIDLCGKLTPLESASVLKKCKLTISNDTGPMHLSYSVGTRVIALFSARDFKNKWYPPKDNNMVFRDNSIDCRICLSETCKDNKCMQNIRPKEVIEYIKEVI